MHRQPGNGVGEAGRDRAVVFRCADHPAGGGFELGFERGNRLRSDLPLFTPRAQAQGTPEAIAPFEAQLKAAPRWVICAPEYNGSIPPCLTNAIAWLSVQGEDFRALFNSRPIAIATFSGGGGMELLLSLRIQLTHLGAEVVGRQLLSNHSKPAKDDSIQDLLHRLGQKQPIQ